MTKKQMLEKMLNSSEYKVYSSEYYLRKMRKKDLQEIYDLSECLISHRQRKERIKDLLR